jgi:hypothetical protein
MGKFLSWRLLRVNVLDILILLNLSMMFRAVFWVVLPCKMIVDWRFRGAYCLHHQGWVSRATEGSRFYRCRVTRRSVVVGDDRLGTGQWQWAGGGSRREREVYRHRMWSGCNLALERASLKIGMASMLSGSGDGLGGVLSCPEKDRCTNYSCTGGLSMCFQGVDKWFPWPAKNETII